MLRQNGGLTPHSDSMRRQERVWDQDMMPPGCAGRASWVRGRHFSGDNKLLDLGWPEGLLRWRDYICHSPRPPPGSSSIFRSGDWALHPSFICYLISLSLFGAYIFQALQSNPCLWQYFGSKFLPFPLVAEALGTKLAEPWDRALPWQGTVLQLHLCSDSDQWVGSGAAWNFSQFSVTSLWMISKRIFSIIVTTVLCFEIKFWMYIYNITGLVFCVCGGGGGGTFLCNKSALNTVWLLSTCKLNKFLIQEFCTNENSHTHLLCADEMEKP